MQCGSAWLVYVKAQTSLCIQAMTVNAATQRNNATSLGKLFQKKDWKSSKAMKVAVPLASEQELAWTLAECIFYVFLCCFCAFHFYRLFLVSFFFPLI